MAVAKTSRRRNRVPDLTQRKIPSGTPPAQSSYALATLEDLTYYVENTSSLSAQSTSQTRR